MVHVYVYIYINVRTPNQLINWGLLLLLLKLMDSLNNKLQLLKEEDGIKKNKNKNKKKISRTSSSSNSCVNSTSGKIKSPTSSGNSGSKEGGGGGGVMKLSTDPQSVAARQRRHRISERFKMLQSLIPGGSKMDTVSMLEEAIHYVKFLKTQLWLHQTIMMNINDLTDIDQHASDIDHHLFLNSIMNFNSSDSSPITNPHVNNMINNLSLSSSPPPPVQYPPQQFLYSSSSSSSTSSSTTTATYIPAAGISAGMATLPPTPTTTFPPVFCYDHQDDDA